MKIKVLFFDKFTNFNENIGINVIKTFQVKKYNNFSRFNNRNAYICHEKTYFQ